MGASQSRSAAAKVVDAARVSAGPVVTSPARAAARPPPQPVAAAAAGAGAAAPSPQTPAPDTLAPTSTTSAIERDAQRAAALQQRRQRRALTLEEEDALEAEDAALGGMLARLSGSIVAQARVPGVLPEERERETPEAAAARRAKQREQAAREGVGRLPPAALRELFALYAREREEEWWRSRRRRRTGGAEEEQAKPLVPAAALPLLQRHGVATEAAAAALQCGALPRVRPTKAGAAAAAQAAEQARRAMEGSGGGGGGGGEARARAQVQQLLQQFPWLADEAERAERRRRSGAEGGGGGGGGDSGSDDDEDEDEDEPPAAAPGVIGIATWPRWWTGKAVGGGEGVR